MQLNDPSLLKTESYINGKFIKSAEIFPVKNPFDGKVLAHVADLGVEETTEAIKAASDAFRKWSKTPAGERATILKRWYTLQMEHLEDLAMILTLEQGKPLAESRAEIAYGASFIEWFAEEARRSYGDVIPGHVADKRIMTIKQPIGVVAAITPWNFPNAMITRKAGPALAAGCTMVVKPAEETPLSALALAELVHRAGIPAGVFNVITSSNPAAVGEVLTTHPLVKKVSFTGSAAVGKKIMQQSAQTVKKVSLELGGNAPFIVFADADLDAAVAGAIQAKFRNAGQTCVAANRIYVQDEVHDEFVRRFTEAAAKLECGNGLEESVEIGPMINKEAIDFIENLLQDALEKGARLTTGSKIFHPDHNVIAPMVLADATEEMALSKEEIFGPLAPVFQFKTEAEVIARANDTPCGLASYCYTNDLKRSWRISEALEYGMVGINTGMISTTVAPFGGVKESGIGREGSKYGMDEYMEIKYVCLGGID